MAKEIALDEAVEILTKAFAPLRCVAEPWDYRKRVRFRIFDAHDEPLLRVDELLVRQVTDPRHLTTVVLAARENLEDRGYELDAWNLDLGR